MDILYLRKRKIDGVLESEESNDEDATSEKSAAPIDISSSEDDSKDTHGLRPDYLKELGINLPFDRWVQVSNFRCNKQELKEVLELAGHVITCSIFINYGKYAKAMYSHPLEAVQAISMLNGQSFYGKKLHIKMVTCSSDTIILPKGLTNVGPGLGVHGKPVRDIAKQYANYLKSKPSLIDDSLFLNPTYFKDDVQSNDGNDTNGSYREGSSTKSQFRIVNVESLFYDDESNICVIQNKKKKLRPDGSDEESEHEDNWEKLSDASTEMPNQSIGNNFQKEPSPETAKLSPDSNSKSEGSKSPTQTNNNTSQNTLSSVPISTGPQMVPYAFQLDECPAPPMIAPLNQSCPPGPFVPLAQPLALSVHRIRPPFPPVGSPADLSFRPPGPFLRPPGPPPRPPGSFPRPPRPQGSLTRPQEPLSELQHPFRPHMPPGSFQPCLPNPNVAHRPMHSDARKPIILQFKNLPPSTTFALLSEKVAQCGPLLSLQLTSPGYAIAKFVHPVHADRCLQFFHGLFIDGHVIEVHYV